ncbi:MAG: HlyD family efflux transporter periplasmic adaptor subunit [Planctomycetales bacterium]|nr:HlyD family efflux transporter periplasmic adaptor subunit [Planctomycetales bacterium]
MGHIRWIRWRCVIGIAVLVLSSASAWAWQAAATKSSSKEDTAPESAGQEVVIKREAITIVPPETYKVSLQLHPAKLLDMTAPLDGIVRSVTAQPGQKLAKEADPIRLDDSRPSLILRRAKAHVQAATIEKKMAQAKNDSDLVALADARLEAAQADFELAQSDVSRAIIRTPFAGNSLRVHVVEGQFVRAGDRLLSLADTSKLQVEIPIDRSQAKVGDQIELKVEGAAINAKIEALLPLASQFESMRDLAASPASALVSIDNAQGKLAAGQTVHTKLIPLEPVALVPSVGVTNVPDGNRKVQVLRSRVVRNIVVQILAQVGTERVYISGPLIAGDEIIVNSSQELPDGTVLRSRAGGDSLEVAAPKGSNPATTRPAAGKTNTKSGF